MSDLVTSVIGASVNMAIIVFTIMMYRKIKELKGERSRGNIKRIII